MGWAVGWRRAGGGPGRRRRLLGPRAPLASMDDAPGPSTPPSSHSTKAVIETPPGETWQIAFAPPGASPGGDPLVASAGGASNKVVLWSTDDAEKVAELLLPGGEGDDRRKDAFVLSVAYSPDGRRLACGSVDGGVAVFDVASGALLHSLVGHFKPVRSLAFTPGERERTGRWVLSGRAAGAAIRPNPRCPAPTLPASLFPDPFRLQNAGHGVRRHALPRV